MSNRNVSVLILHKNGKILLQKRPDDTSRFPDTWGLFGGGIEDGETQLEAIKREVLEELNLKLVNPKFTHILQYELSETSEEGKIFVFFEEYNNESLGLNDGQEMKWFDIDETQKINMHDIYKDIIKEIVRQQLFVVS